MKIIFCHFLISGGEKKMATKIAIKMATKCTLVPVEMSFMANLGFLLKYVFSAWYLRTSSMNNELGC
jgi:hypothetical protein